MKKTIIVVCMLVTTVWSTTGQTMKLKANVAKPELFATTGIGLSFLNPSFKQISNNGYKTYTGVEIQVANHYWTRLSYELSLYSFNNIIYKDGFKISNKGSRTFLGGFIDLGYRKKFSNLDVYLYGGFGVGGLSAPNTNINLANLEVSSEPLKKIHTAFRTGIGAELEIKPRFIPYIEYQYGGLLQKTKVDGRSLFFSNILIGFKARLKRKN
jgi:hypothetical protein